MRSLDMDDLYMEYDELVEAGEIDPKQVSVEDYVQDKISSAIDWAHDSLKDEGYSND